jgi:type II secretory pathway component PulF
MSLEKTESKSIAKTCARLWHAFTEMIGDRVHEVLHEIDEWKHRLGMRTMSMSKIETIFARFMFKNLGSAGRRRLWLKLAKMMSNDVQLLQAIDSIRDRRIAAGGRAHPETIALASWGKLLRNGKRLSTAIVGWVGNEEIMLIDAGEQSGRMDEALKSAVKMMEAKKAISGAIIGGLAYPLFLVMMAFGVMYLFGFKIVPAFTAVVQGNNWQGMAKLMIEMSVFSQKWLWLVALIFVSVILLFFISLPSFDGALRVRLDRYVPYSIYRTTQGSSWIIATAALVSAGVRIEPSLEKLAKTGSPWLKRRLDACLVSMRSGLNMGDALGRTGYEFPDREIIDDLAIYAALSGFNEALLLLGNEWIEESVKQIKAKMQAVFGFSIMLVGGLVALMVTGMMEMQLQMSQMLQQAIR